MTEKKGKAPRKKPISVKQLEKQAKKLNEYSTFTIDPEQNLVIKYYEKFDDIKIQALLEEAYQNLTYVQQNELDFFTSDDQFLQYIYFLIAVRFTHLENEVTHDIESQIPIMRNMISTGLFNVIFEDVLDGNEVMKVIDRLEKMQEAVNKILHLEDEHRKKVLENVQNPEILNFATKEDE